MIKASSRIEMKELIYEDTARYDFWLKLILGSVLAILFIIGVVLLFIDILGASVMFGVTLFDALLFKAILPRRFQIFQDRIKIILGGPFTISISFSNIREVRAVSANEVFVYWGVRLATSTQSVVEIVRKSGLSLVIAPANREMFLEQFNQANSASQGQ